MTLTNVFDHYRQHLSRMVKPSTREDYNKRLATLSKYCAMQSSIGIADLMAEIEEYFYGSTVNYEVLGI